MVKLLKGLLVLNIILIGVSCSNDESAIEESGRPFEPWVFRSVIDDVPRAISFAMDDDLWVSYATESGALYKAWKGAVDFDGAVYTSSHGPQPRIIGDAYIHNNHQNPWVIKSGETISSLDVQYLGHRLTGDQAEMMFELISSEGDKFLVNERPEAIVSDNGNVGFERVFTIKNPPANKEIGLKTNISSIIRKGDVVTNGNFEIITEKEAQYDQITALELDGILWLSKDEPTSYVVNFSTKPLLKNLLYQDKNENVSGTNEGLTLISKSDCRTCHNVKAKTIGPSYMEIASRYKATEENTTYLISKIKNGGSGIWGAQVMTPHPDLPDNDVKKMISYILGLVPEAEKEGNNETLSSGDIEFLDAQQVNEGDIIMGSVTKVYKIRPNTKALPDFKTIGAPMMGGLMPNFDNLSDGKFIDLTDNFAIEAEGFLDIEKDMKVIFRMWSDDGSRLYINDQMIVDHDGTHGTSSKENTIGLKKGFHKFRIEYFNGGGGRFLSFNWKPEGKSAFEVVPQAVIYHDRNKQESIKGLSLPMSVQRTIPGDQTALDDVHPSFDLTQARPNAFTPKVGGMDFLPDGRLVVSVWDAEGGVYVIENASSGDPSQMTYKRIAAGLAEPLGLKVVDGDIYVMQKQELTRLVDTDDDGIMDEYHTVSNDWKVSTNFHEFGFGLAYKDGYFYAALAVAILPGGASAQPQIPDRGKVVKINKETGETSFVAQGLRTPNGIAIGIDDEIFIADNQGDWLPASKIIHVREGDFFGGRAVDFEGTASLREKPPVVWLPQDEIGNSPSTPIYINVGPYKGQMIHGEVTNGGIKRVFVEEVNGDYQGALFRFTQGLEAGVNRIIWGPDGALYIGGVGNPGNWQHVGKNWYGLQRLAYNGKSTFEMLAVRAKTNGMEIEFTEPLKSGDGWDKTTYEIQQWYYKPTADYGGPKLNLTDLDIRSVNVSDDRKRVFLEVAGIKPDHVVYLHINDNLVSDQGNELWSSECWYTMNNIPANNPGFRTSRPFLPADNTLTPAEKEAGWELLFDGQSTAGWKNFKKEGVGSSWIVKDGMLTLNSELDENGKWNAVDGGDIITLEQYENFDFSIDWKISNCGNSGVLYFVQESEEFQSVWHTGPEMQILDNTCHPDTKYPTHRAGDLYDLIETKYVTVNPAGEWNTARIVSKDGKIEHWLNGRKVVEVEMFTDEWQKMISNSKFKDLPAFGTFKKGHLCLQDHDDPVWFKNIKINRL